METPHSSFRKGVLGNQFKDFSKEPIDGIYIHLENDQLDKWICYIQGPKDTYYEGGIFKLVMTFPNDYPMQPPKLKFITPFWHPNVYPNGDVCISILHPPADDEMSGELSSERWSPVQNANSILLSTISMLNDPNVSSPANIDASLEYRFNRDSYQKRISGLVKASLESVPSFVQFSAPEPEEEEELDYGSYDEISGDFDISFSDDE